MSAKSTTFVTHLDGCPATAADLSPLAFAGFAHFTAMQVRDRNIRGLDLHLARLRAASMALYGAALPDERVRSYLKAAIDNGPGNQSLTATAFSRAGEFTADEIGDEPAMLVRTGPASDGPRGALKLIAIDYERPIPAIKLVGETVKTYYLRQAVGQGFDDAAFVDARGRLSEGTIWNFAFWDGEAVVWPEAAMLTGTTMGILQRQLDKLGVRQRREEVTLDSLGKMVGAVVMNSWSPGIAVTSIGSVDVPQATSFLSLLHDAYQAEPLVSL